MKNVAPPSASVEMKRVPARPLKVYLLTTLVIACVLTLRLSMVFKASSLVWEDGSVFLTGALARSLWQNFLTPYAGYYHLIPRIFAQLATVYNLHSVPFIYIASSIIVVSPILALPVLPAFSGVMSMPWRIGFAVLCALIPIRTEAYGNLAHLHWFAFWGLTLFSFADLGKISEKWLIVSVFLVFLSVYSSPPAVILIPLYLLQAYRYRASRTAIVLCSCFVLFAVSYALICSRLDETNAFVPLSLREIAVFTSKTVGFKSILVPLFGDRFASLLLQISWLSIGVFIIFAALMVGAATICFRSRRFDTGYRYFAQLYVVVASVAIVPVTRPIYIDHFLVKDQWNEADRYYLTPAFLFLLCLAQAFAALGHRMRPRPMSLAILFCATIYAAPVAFNFRIPAYWKWTYDWSRDVKTYYEEIVETNSGEDRTQPYSIRVYPGGAWAATLPPTGSFTEQQRNRIAALLK